MPPLLLLKVDQGLRLRWCRLTFPDGQDQLIQTEHPGVYERYGEQFYLHVLTGGV